MLVAADFICVSPFLQLFIVVCVNEYVLTGGSLDVQLFGISATTIGMAGGLHPPPEVIASWPNPNYVDPQTRGYGQVILCAVLGFFSIFTVSIRLWTRARVTNNFGIDDFIILLAMVWNNQ